MKLVKSIIKHRGVGFLLWVKIFFKLVGVTGFLLMIGGAAMGFLLGAKHLKQKWNLPR